VFSSITAHPRGIVEPSALTELTVTALGWSEDTLSSIDLTCTAIEVKVRGVSTVDPSSSSGIDTHWCSSGVEATPVRTLITVNNSCVKGVLPSAGAFVAIMYGRVNTFGKSACNVVLTVKFIILLSDSTVHSSSTRQRYTERGTSLIDLAQIRRLITVNKSLALISSSSTFCIVACTWRSDHANCSSSVSVVTVEVLMLRPRTVYSSPTSSVNTGRLPFGTEDTPVILLVAIYGGFVEGTSTYTL